MIKVSSGFGSAIETELVMAKRREIHLRWMSQKPLAQPGGNLLDRNISIRP
jgi:hypothetical protein